MIIEKGIISDIVMGVHGDVAKGTSTHIRNDENQSIRNRPNPLESLKTLFLGKYMDELPWIHPGGLENALNELIKHT